MNLMYEDLARAHMRERYRQARNERLSHLVARVRKARRSAAEVARLVDQANAAL